MSTETEVDRIKSYHIFMFPFKWEHREYCNLGLQEKARVDLGKRFELNRFESKLRSEKGRSNWQRKSIELTHESYNEYNYYYPHVREILYDLDVTLQTEDSQGNDGLVRHYEYEPAKCKNLHYEIKVAKRTDPYSLDIDSIHLNIYGTGTGVLVFHLRNFKYERCEDILKINQYGRRIFPPFFSLDNDWVSSGKPNTNHGGELLQYVQENELAEYISIEKRGECKCQQDSRIGLENFSAYLNKDYFKHGPFELPQFMKGLFNENFFSGHKKNIEQSKIYIRPVLDDRMFVVCWYGNNEKVEELQEYGNDALTKRLSHKRWKGRVPQRAKDEYTYITSRWWYKYIFVDGGNDPTCQNREMLRHFNKEHTYSRWIDWGSLYGISRYSLVMLSTPIGTAEKQYYNGVPTFLVGHMQTIYYKMAELCLIQRATVLSFSDEVTHVSDLTRRGEDSKEVLKTIQDLYEKYILFVNKIYFREVTAQEQGIDMYDMLQKHMRLKEDIKDLDQEIEELHNYAKIVAEKKNSELLTKISVLGAIFLPIGFMVSIFNMSSLPDYFLRDLNIKSLFYTPFISRLLAIGVFSSLLVLLINWFFGLRIMNHLKIWFKRKKQS